MKNEITSKNLDHRSSKTTKTNVDLIFDAVKIIYNVKKKDVFTRNDIRKELGLTSEEWELRYTGGFQGMIENAPPLKNLIRPKYRAMFRRIEKGLYQLTPYGLSIIENDK